ncbi:MAG TPA: DUF4430 domain-containing protein [Patescibacteria group bacterium]
MKKASVFVSILIVSSLIFSACAFQAQPAQPVVSPPAVEESPGDNKDVTYEFIATQSGTVALDLLQSKADIETKDFGGAGKFVTSINDLAADEGHYWGFYVNDEYAHQGVSQTILEEGDTIRFTYEKIDPTQQ